MFNSVFNELGAVWTAAAVGTLLVPVMLLVAWRTAALVAETSTGRRIHRALNRAFPIHRHPRAAKALPGHSSVRSRGRSARRH